MTAGGYSIEELSERSGLSYKHVQEFTHHLHCVVPKVIHVEYWRETKHGYAIIPIYKWGNAPDARRVPALTAAQRQQRYRDKKKKLKQQELLTFARRADHDTRGETADFPRVPASACLASVLEAHQDS